MMFEYALDIGPDRDGLHRTAKEIAYHSHVSGIRQFHEDCEIRSVLTQSIVRGVPDALPAEDAATRLDLDPFKVKRMAMMAEPFGSELPGPAMRAALHQEAALLQSRPVRRRQSIGFGYRDW